ncbi:MAG TPA: isoprenylcysteine carboxylmethyltransferase family protein [bacterium]|jgi:protein-S-isoprenylcysteine O-methyltransferase Ste14
MLIHELEEQGNWLFRWRTWIPLVLLPFGVLALAEHNHYLGDSEGIELFYGIGCFLISLSGLVIRGIALGYAQPGSSGRNTQRQIADHLNTSGIYSVVRHPLYLGNILMVLGVMLFTKSFMFALAGMLFYLLFYERIMAAEELFLSGKFGDTYRAWADQTPALLPRFSQWRSPGYPFSLRAAIKGEFYGFTALVSVILFMDFLKYWFTEGRLGVDLVWLALFALSVVTFFVLRHLRKHTAFFEGPQVKTQN